MRTTPIGGLKSFAELIAPAIATGLKVADILILPLAQPDSGNQSCWFALAVRISFNLTLTKPIVGSDAKPLLSMTLTPMTASFLDVTRNSVLDSHIGLWLRLKVEVLRIGWPRK